MFHRSKNFQEYQAVCDFSLCKAYMLIIFFSFQQCSLLEILVSFSANKFFAHFFACLSLFQAAMQSVKDDPTNFKSPSREIDNAIRELKPCQLAILRKVTR
jgi:hypothetical protein